MTTASPKRFISIHSTSYKRQRFRKKTETGNIKRGSFSMDPQLQYKTQTILRTPALDAAPTFLAHPLIGTKNATIHLRCLQNNTERVQAKHQCTAGKTAKRQAGQFYLALPFVYSRPLAPEKAQYCNSTFSLSSEPTAAGTVERDGLFRTVVLFRHACVGVRVDLPPRAAVSQGM
ncbi:unnamed protein product [Laminaria digitata]